MKNKVWKIINIIILIAVIAIAAYEIGFAVEGDRSAKTVLKVAFVIIVWELSMLGIKRKRSALDYRIYEDKYREIIRDAFKNDKKSYRKLMSAIRLYNEDKYDEEIKILDRLKSSCISSHDTSAVLMFKALGLAEKKLYNEAISVYQELLKYDNMNSKAWSNLGYNYTLVNNSQAALEAYENALRYDGSNPYAYTNMANYYIKSGEPEKALEYSLKAIELDNQIYQAMSAASMAYAYLGDRENAMKYCKMYGVNGGDVKMLKSKVEAVLEVK